MQVIIFVLFYTYMHPVKHPTHHHVHTFDVNDNIAGQSNC